MKIEENESFYDRMARAIIGVILLYLGAAGVVAGVVGIILAVLGALLLLSAAAGFDPIYKLLHIHSN